jgi:protein-disulfide isomerase
MEPQTNNLAMPIAVVIGAALIAGAVYLSGGVHATAPAQQPPAGNQPAAQAVDATKVNMTGEPFIGNPQAPLTIAYWFDYQCPFCKQNELVNVSQLVTDYVNTGKAKVVFKDFAFLGPDSQTLGQYARAVWAYAPDKFYAWHHAVFAAQGTENTGWATVSEIKSITSSVLGADGASKVAALVKANGATYQKAMDADKAEGAALGVSGTPSMIVGTQAVQGAVPYSQLKSAIDAQLAKK